ncbi:hypothetical protein F3Y22_tig00110015pilonHSYRG00036 [Hibiscus syriacus]|uniref:U-box domain-containing protein n=1 Tax=Hibiscus syriacus TaxID=106335 RepID=A0A6A3BNT7_HIBSY|nr:hypothetical protein F3Y22_tig00110015pilonHSYRG00036 [Hibiscus syriacus]
MAVSPRVLPLRKRRPSPSHTLADLNLINSLLSLSQEISALKPLQCLLIRKSLSIINKSKLLAILFEELLRDSVSNVFFTPSTLLCFEEMYIVLQRTKALIEDCSNGSKMLMLMQISHLACSFHELTLELSTVLDIFPVEEFDLSQDVEELVVLLRKQCSKSKPWVDLRDGSEEISSLQQEIQKQIDEKSNSEIVSLIGLVRYTKCVLFGSSTTEKPDYRRRKSMSEITVLVALMCPVSLELMRDAVVVASGQSYDRESINQWIESRHNALPFEMAGKNNKVNDVRAAFGATKMTVSFLVNKLSVSPSMETANAVIYELRALAKIDSDTRTCIAEAGAIPILSHLHLSLSNATSVPISDEISLHLRRYQSPSPAKSFTNFYSAQLTLRNKVSLTKTIASKLSPTQRKIFEDTCFGPWLKVQHPGGDAMLTHLFLQTMTSDLPETIQRRDEEIWFDFPPAYTCFGREEFCLITGLRFRHDDVYRALSWKRKQSLQQWEDLLPYTTINNEANTPLQRLTPTEAELATDWWQASKHFFDGTDDEQPPLREPSPHPKPSPDRPEYTPPQRESSPILSHHRASSPPSPHDRRPAKMPRLAKMPRRLSPYSPPPPPPPPPRDELGELRNEVNALREEVGTLRDDNGAWRVGVSTLRGEVAALREIVASLQNDVHTLRNEATVIVEEVSSNILEPDSHGVIYQIIEKSPYVPDMMDDCWLSYKLSANTIPADEVERKQLPEIIMDNTLWAKTAVDFYLHERSQGCYADIYKLNDDMHLLIERSWWGVLLGIEDNDYFDGGHIDAWVTRLLIVRKLKKNIKKTRYTIMPTSFHVVHLKNQRHESYVLANGQAKLYLAWWEVDKVFIPVLERTHWLLVELQLPSLKTIVYDITINYISLSDLRDIIKGWSSHLAKFLDAINYWTNSGNKKPKKFNVTVIRDETAPQKT